MREEYLETTHGVVHIKYNDDTKVLVVNAPLADLSTMQPDEVNKFMSAVKARVDEMIREGIKPLDVSMKTATDSFDTSTLTEEQKRAHLGFTEPEKKPEKKRGRITLFVFLIFKFFGKALTISAKMTKMALVGISFAAYAYLFTWQFAAVIIIQLLIHEYGHVWAMKRCGIKTKGIYLIPFFGGAAVASEAFRTRWEEVYVAIMGPVFGFLCAAACYIVWMVNGEPFFAAASSWMAMLNLLNLIPINPLDGGRIAKSLTFSIRRGLGILYLALASISLFTLSIMYGWVTLGILGTISVIELAIEWKMTKPENFLPGLSKIEMLRSISIYIFVAAACFLLMHTASSVPGAALAMELFK